MHRVFFYSTPRGSEVVLEWIRSFEPHERKQIGEDLRAVQLGFPLGLPLCRNLGGGLWEVRSTLTSRRELRLVFFHSRKHEALVVVHGMIKKTQKIPAADIDIARKRMREIRDRGLESMSEGTKARSVQDLTSLDDFLDEDGINEEVTLRAIKRVIAMQLDQEMRSNRITKAELARRMNTSRAQVDRVLDPEVGNVTIETLARAARIVGRSLRLELY